jgi:hypothetical protein
MAHGYDGRGRVTDEENDHRLRGNETEAIKDAREMKHGYDGRGRVRKFGPGETDESIADDRERYEERKRHEEAVQSGEGGDGDVDHETGSHSKRRKDDEGHVIRGERQTWQQRYGRDRGQSQGRQGGGQSQGRGRQQEEEEDQGQENRGGGRKTWKQFAGSDRR